MTERPPLILKRGAPSRRRADDYDMLENGVVVGRIFKAQVAPPDRPWMWASGLARRLVAVCGALDRGRRMTARPHPGAAPAAHGGEGTVRGQQCPVTYVIGYSPFYELS